MLTTISVTRGTVGHRRGSLVSTNPPPGDLSNHIRQRKANYREQVPPFSAPMAHSNSMVWVSPREAAHDRWIAVKENLSRIRFDRSPFVPQAFAEYVEHLATQAEDSAKEEKKRLAEREALQTYAGASQHPWIIPFEGKKFSDNRSPVLALPSVWSPWYEFTRVRPESPWPSPEEFKEEGDERHTSGFGRFLPVPRVAGNSTVAYGRKAFLLQYPLDFVNPVLCREPPPSVAQEEEYTIADLLMADQHVDFRAEAMNQGAFQSINVAHPFIQQQASTSALPNEDVHRNTLENTPPSLEVEVDSATEGDAETPIADGVGETVVADDHVLDIALAGDHSESQLVATEVETLFKDPVCLAAVKGVESIKGTGALTSPQEYAETTVEEDNETIVSESTLDNEITMVKIDVVKDIEIAGLEA